MKLKSKSLIICIIIPLIVGIISGFLSRGSMETFQLLNKPPLSPPGWIFPVVWTILFILMGISSYLVFTSSQGAETVKRALIIYALQLTINFFWPIFFFRFELYLFSFMWLVVLWVFILITIILFYRIVKPAAYFMIPYMLWVTYAGYLNLSIYLLNR